MFLAHFYGNPYSVFCIGISNDMSTEEELDFFGSIIPSLRTLSSFQKFIEKMINEGRIKRDKNLMRMARILLEDDEELLRYIDTARKEKELYTKNLPQAWILFDILQSSWLEGRLSTETLLNDYFTGNLSKRTSLSCRNLLNARDDVILDFLRRTQESVHLVSLDILDLRNSLEELEDLIQGGTRQVGLTRLVNGNIHGSIAKSDGDKRFTALVKDLSEGLDRYFKYVVAQSLWQTKKNGVIFENTIVKSADLRFLNRSHLKPFTELTFHEIWYPEVHRVMRNVSTPHVR